MPVTTTCRVPTVILRLIAPPTTTLSPLTTMSPPVTVPRACVYWGAEAVSGLDTLCHDLCVTSTVPASAARKPRPSSLATTVAVTALWGVGGERIDGRRHWRVDPLRLCGSLRRRGSLRHPAPDAARAPCCCAASSSFCIILPPDAIAAALVGRGASELVVCETVCVIRTMTTLDAPISPRTPTIEVLLLPMKVSDLLGAESLHLYVQRRGDEAAVGPDLPVRPDDDLDGGIDEEDRAGRRQDAVDRRRHVVVDAVECRAATVIELNLIALPDRKARPEAPMPVRLDWLIVRLVGEVE